MRGIAIYGDKIFVATSNAHLMAFDARTGKVVWDTTIGDRSKGEYSTTSGPIAVKGKLIQGLGGCADVSRGEVLHQRLRRQDRQGSVALLAPLRSKASRAAIPGEASRQPSRGRRKLDHRQLRSGLEPHLLGHRAGQALDAREPRIGQRRDAVCQLHRWR